MGKEKMNRIKEEIRQDRLNKFTDRLNISLLEDQKQQSKLFNKGVDRIRADLEKFEIEQLAAQATKDLVTKGFHEVADL